MRILLLLILAVLPLQLQAAPKKEKEPVLPAELPTLPHRKLVPHEKLIPFLPPVPPDWAADKPEGSTTDSEELHISTASRRYYVANAPTDDIPSASVTIIDSTNNDDFFDSDGGTWENEVKTEEGYDKRITINGMRAVEHYDKAAKTASLSVFVARRFFVQIELSNLNPKELHEWLKRVDIKGLSQLK